MKLTLKDYQAEAVGHLLAALERAKKLYFDDEDRQETSVALTAPTGAGKTVIAAAVIEALFFGSDRFDFAPDPGAVVIWFSDDPNLNDQSRFRLMQASEKLTWTRLVHVKPPFAKRQLEPGKVYFLNTQRLSKSSLLTRGMSRATPTRSSKGSGRQPHRMNSHGTFGRRSRTRFSTTTSRSTSSSTKRTGASTTGHPQSEGRLVRRLIAGDETGYQMPIVLGISATIGRFSQAMEAAEDAGHRLALPDVNVEPSRVQASGLVKDTVILDIPGEGGDFGTTLVTEAAKRLKESALRWKKYALQQREAEVVVPLLVFQIPNTPDADDVGAGLDAIHSVDLSIHRRLGAPRPRWQHDGDVRSVGGRLNRATAGSGDYRGTRARREGSDLDRVGLSARRSPRESPRGQGSDAHRTAARADGSQPTGATHPRQRPAERGRLHPAVLRPNDGRQRREVHDRPGSTGSRRSAGAAS